MSTPELYIPPDQCGTDSWQTTREQDILASAAQCFRLPNLVQSIQGLQSLFLSSQDMTVRRTIEAFLHLKALEASEELARMGYTPTTTGDES